jgi:putative photosynthetic complex assembly protein 2
MSSTIAIRCVRLSNTPHAAPAHWTGFPPGRPIAYVGCGRRRTAQVLRRHGKRQPTMVTEIATAALYATFLWWFSTGVIFFLNARPQRTFRWSMIGGSLLVVAALFGIWASAGIASPLGAFIAFTCGVVVWGWHTMSYYMGVITGPRRHRCPPGCRGWRHFVHGVNTGLYHELAIIATAALIAALTWGAPNQFGLWTFVVLWAMHVSAKLNVFLGVRNLNKEFIPEHLGYLTSYFRRRSMNLLFPFSVTIGTGVTLALMSAALEPGATPFFRTGHILLATLMALAVIEHWFMILPIPADVLWRWSLRPTPLDYGTGTSAESSDVRAQGNTTATTQDPNGRSRPMAGKPARPRSAGA